PPFPARLSDSVPPEVNTTSRGRHPSTPATCRRAFSSPWWAARPQACTLEGLPYFSVKYGSMASSTTGSTPVVAAWSRYTERSGIPLLDDVPLVWILITYVLLLFAYSYFPGT